MRRRSYQDEILNIAIPTFVTVIIFVLCGIFFDCYYDLNDDMVIKDILAGCYTGKPDGHTYQLLYPLGFFLSKCYFLFRNAPVFGIFLSACFFVCFCLTGYRSLSFFKDSKGKVVVAFIEGSVLFTVYLKELVYMQYSVVSGILAATACFWFYTIPKGLEEKSFWKQGLPSLVLVWIAFLVRSEMLLFMFPFLVSAGLFHWLEEAKKQKEEYVGPEKRGYLGQMFCKKNLFRYPGFLAVMALGLLLLFSLDKMAYRSAEWKSYGSFFDARTKVYDYTWYPSYEEGKEFYEEKGITKEQYQLIDSYNFGLDTTIDDTVLGEIADYGQKQKMLGSTGTRIRNLVWEMIHNTFSGKHGPYNYLVLLSFVLVLGLAFVQKRKDYLWKLGFMIVMRSVCWSYLIWSARVVDRVAHPLYLAEFLLLLAVLVSELYERPLWNVEKYYRRAVAFAFLLYVLLAFPVSFQSVKDEVRQREEILENQALLDDYCKQHRENYYYLDVYSSVSFSEKVYGEVDNSFKNYDLLGGWLCNSPLQTEARRNWLVLEDEKTEPEEIRIDGISEALLGRNCYLVIESTADTGFLKDFYEAGGKEVSLELEDRVGKGGNPFLIYELKEKIAQENEKQTGK